MLLDVLCRRTMLLEVGYQRNHDLGGLYQTKSSRVGKKSVVLLQIRNFPLLEEVFVHTFQDFSFRHYSSHALHRNLLIEEQVFMRLFILEDKE
jgi:hypothetical protein